MSTVQAAAVYCRISQDRKGEALGVARQEELCVRLAADKSWPVAEVYCDNDVSAYGRKPRPEYERMLADLESGTRDAVLVVDQDRLTRHPAELETFIDFADRRRIPLANVSGDIDLSTSDGRFKARIMGAVARQESEKKSERIRRQREQAARLGRPNGGRRPFGYRKGGLELEPAEAELVREAVDRVLVGESLRTVARDWNARGVPSASGREWMVTSLRTLLSGPRIAGLRVHRGEVVGEAAWQAIITREEHERLRAVLGDPRRRQRGRPAVNLLTGMLICGRCGRRMASSRRIDGSRRYSCHPTPGTGACGRVAVVAQGLEEHVVDVVLAAVAGPELDAAMRTSTEDDEVTPLVEQLRADEHALEQLSRDYYVDRIIGRAEFLAAREALEERMKAARQAVERAGRRTIVSVVAATEEALRAEWGRRGLDWRRALLAAVLAAVIVHPVRLRGRRTFDPDRIELRWDS